MRKLSFLVLSLVLLISSTVTKNVGAECLPGFDACTCDRVACMVNCMKYGPPTLICQSDCWRDWHICVDPSFANQ